MDWWQVLLILLGSIVIGFLLGILLSYLINRFIRPLFGRPLFMEKPTAAPVAAGTASTKTPSQFIAARLAETQATGNDLRERAAAVTNRVPLPSGRSFSSTILILALGLIVGTGLGLGYWSISPINAQVEVGWPPVRLSGPPPTLYQSTANVLLMGRGTASQDLKTLQRQGEYYTAKMNTLPFFEFLGEAVEVQAPEYAHPALEMAQMVKTKYNYDSDVPTVEIKVSSPDAQETYFLASMMGQVLQDYLTEEERTLQLEKSQQSQADEDNLKAALISAEAELNRLKALGDTGDTSINPANIALSAKVRALERELDLRSRQLAALIAAGDNLSADYQTAEEEIARTTVALSDARTELVRLETGTSLSYEQIVAYTSAEAKVEMLNRQLRDLAREQASTFDGNAGGRTGLISLNIGEASAPNAIPLERTRGRNALMMGAVLGLAGAWLALNYKWVAREVRSFAQAKPEPEEEDEEDES